MPEVLVPQNPEILRTTIPVLAKACGLQTTDEQTLAAEVEMPPFFLFPQVFDIAKKQKRKPFILALDRTPLAV